MPTVVIVCAFDQLRDVAFVVQLMCQRAQIRLPMNNVAFAAGRVLTMRIIPFLIMAVAQVQRLMIVREQIMQTFGVAGILLMIRNRVLLYTVVVRGAERNAQLLGHRRRVTVSILSNDGDFSTVATGM